MTEHNTRALVIAGSVEHAITTMSIDWRWRRQSANFYDPKDRVIHIVGGAQHLRGWDMGTPVYFAFESHKHPAAPELYTQMGYRRFVRHDHATGEPLPATPV